MPARRSYKKNPGRFKTHPQCQPSGVAQSMSTQRDVTFWEMPSRAEPAGNWLCSTNNDGAGTGPAAPVNSIWGQTKSPNPTERFSHTATRRGGMLAVVDTGLARDHETTFDVDFERLRNSLRYGRREAQGKEKREHVISPLCRQSLKFHVFCRFEMLARASPHQSDLVGLRGGFYIIQYIQFRRTLAAPKSAPFSARRHSFLCACEESSSRFGGCRGGPSFCQTVPPFRCRRAAGHRYAIQDPHSTSIHLIVC